MSQMTDSARRLEWLKVNECGMPLHKRKMFRGLPGDYLIVDENGRTVWASAWAHQAYIDTCPRMLKRRRS